MEYSIIANCVDGRQLTGSGYHTPEQVARAVTERVRYHAEGMSQLIGIVIVRADGHVVTLDPISMKLEFVSRL